MVTVTCSLVTVTWTSCLYLKSVGNSYNGFGTDELSADLGNGFNGFGTDELSADLGNGFNGFGTDALKQIMALSRI